MPPISFAGLTTMLKFGISAGICFEWVYGPAVNSLHSLASAGIRAAVGGLLAWMVLEAVRGVWRTVMLLDDQPRRRIDPRPTVIGK